MRTFIQIIISFSMIAVLTACDTASDSNYNSKVYKPRVYKPRVFMPAIKQSPPPHKHMTVEQMIEESKASHSSVVKGRPIKIPPANTKPIVKGKPIKIPPSSTKPILTGEKAVKEMTNKATEQAIASRFVNGIMTYNFAGGLLYTIYTAPMHITDIRLQKGEQIRTVSAGDTVRWRVEETSSGQGSNTVEQILVKPVNTSINNTLVITTNKRTYYLLLKSTNNSFTPMVAWHYRKHNPGSINRSYTPDVVKGLSVDMNKLNFNYNVKIYGADASLAWKPDVVYNNGEKTFIKFSGKLQNWPTLFVGKHPHLVNYRVIGDYYIVDGIFHEAELSLGKGPLVQISYKG